LCNNSNTISEWYVYIIPQNVNKKANMLNKSELYAAALEKAKVAFSVDTDTALAEVLGIHRSTLCQSKARGSFPYRGIIDACIEKDISIDWIMGIKQQKISNGAAQ
jgi:hypothetical protein